ncbi:MAG: hypothetical protein ACFBWO_11985 [Paracoccaceae bacterium]
MPAASCPATGLSARDAADTAEAARQALSACFARARADEADGPACGCRLVGVDDKVLLARSETGFAVGTPARVSSRDMGLDDIWVARESESGDLALYDLAGPVGRVAFDGRGGARLELPGEPAAFAGVARAVGFRRGRRAWRLYLADPRGRRVSLLVGFSPAELAESAGAWLAFPPDLAAPSALAGAIERTGTR